MKKNIKTIKELMAGGSSVYGAPSFRGGPYGAGHKKQLATTLNPSTKAMEDQEQEELNQNIEDQQRSLGKYQHVKGEPFQDIHGDPKHQRDMEAAKKYDPVLDERNDADMFYTHTPGFPRHNALEDAKIHLPDENFVVTDLRAGRSDGTEDYVLDDIVDNLDDLENQKKLKKIEDNIVEQVLVRLVEFSGGGSGGGNFTYQAKSALPPIERLKEPEHPPGQLGHVNIEPSEKSPPGSHGTIMFPKSFVPDEWPQESTMFDRDLDGISDDIDLDQKSELEQEIDEMKKTPRKTVNEKFASKAQQKYFYAQAAKGGKKGKKWKKMADEFSSKTNYEDLPEKSSKKESIKHEIKNIIKQEILNCLGEEK